MTLVTDLLGLEPEDKTLEFFLKSYNKRVPEIFFASAFPRLPVRQWVLSVPKRLRYFMQRDGPVLNMVLRIFEAGDCAKPAGALHWRGQCRQGKPAHRRSGLHPQVRLQPERTRPLPRLCGGRGV